MQEFIACLPQVSYLRQIFENKKTAIKWKKITKIEPLKCTDEEKIEQYNSTVHEP